MTRTLATLIGTGYAGEDILQKEPWIRALQGHEVHCASRVLPETHFADLREPPARGIALDDLRDAWQRVRSGAASIRYAYEHPPFQRTHSKSDVDELQRWLGVPFRYLASFDRRFFDAREQRDRRPADLIVQSVASFVSFFRDFFQTTKASALVNTVEDDVFSVTAYLVARRLGVRVLGIHLSRFPRRGFMFCDDFQTLAVWNPERPAWSEILGLYDDRAMAGGTPPRTGYWDLGHVGHRFKDALFAQPFEAFRRRALGAHPYEAAIVPRVSLVREAGAHARRVLRRYAVEARSESPVAGEPYVFFPLHYTQDAQITFREPLLDQFRLVRDVARALPEGVNVYVKPHPFFYGTDLSVRELRRLGSLGNVRLVPARLPPQPLVRGARAVVTVNSTSGFEGLVHGVPVVTVGHDFYCTPAYCEVAHDPNDLAPALARALEGPDAARRAGTQDFVRSVYANTVWLQGRDHGHGFFALTPEDGARMATALAGVLEGGPRERGRAKVP